MILNNLDNWSGYKDTLLFTSGLSFLTDR